MSLELLNTLASLLTTLIIAATAIAAIVQLRHLRAGNQIAGQLAMRQVLLDAEFWDAIGRVRSEVPALLKEPRFVKFVWEWHRDGPSEDDDRFDEPYTAALMVGRNLENIGNMIRNGLTDKRIFLEQYSVLVVTVWDAIEPLLKIRREATASDAPWEDFEYLTVLSRKWVAEGRTCYPHDVERILPSFVHPRPSGGEHPIIPTRRGD